MAREFQVGDKVRFIMKFTRTGELTSGADSPARFQSAVVYSANMGAVGTIETVYNNHLPRYDVRLLNGHLIPDVYADFIELLENI